MSAIEFRKVSARGFCIENGCGRKGHHEVFIVGYPVMSKQRQREVICTVHQKQWTDQLNLLAPSREFLEALVADLEGSPTARCDAIDTLRTIGLSPEACARAVKETADGRDSSQILDRMLGVVEPGAVA